MRRPTGSAFKLTLHDLARTATGRTLAASLLVSDPQEPLPTIATVVAAQSALRGAFELMAGPTAPTPGGAA
ncbi:hypothetical protein [Nocardia anaemiae]|uniref:hypothetical protein n=1 Tax=Nocardia anaemiae TaxID=263910 RepID=UPI0012F4A600|nr:hypothetical protein [Nocardia anaemiae]